MRPSCPKSRRSSRWAAVWVVAAGTTPRCTPWTERHQCWPRTRCRRPKPRLRCYTHATWYLRHTWRNICPSCPKSRRSPRRAPVAVAAAPVAARCCAGAGCRTARGPPGDRRAVAAVAGPRPLRRGASPAAPRGQGRRAKSAHAARAISTKLSAAGCTKYISRYLCAAENS